MPFSNVALGHAVIAQLALRAKSKGFNLGKTALQKHIYFLQTLFDFDCGYEFHLYTYGPFSSEVLSDLNEVEFMDGVDVTYDSSIAGYRIRPGTDVVEIVKQGRGNKNDLDEAIDDVLDNFGRFNAKELELRATIVHSEREAREQSSKVKLSDLALVVRELKPHFSKETVVNTIEELNEQGHIMVV